MTIIIFGQWFLKENVHLYDGSENNTGDMILQYLSLSSGDSWKNTNVYKIK